MSRCAGFGGGTRSERSSLGCHRRQDELAPFHMGRAEKPGSTAWWPQAVRTLRLPAPPAGLMSARCRLEQALTPLDIAIGRQ